MRREVGLGKLEVKGGKDGDDVTVRADARVGGKLIITTGKKNDAIAITNASVGGGLRIGSGGGSDTITGFDADVTGGQDQLDISALGITAGNFAASVTITDLGADTQVAIGTDSILLVGVNGTAPNIITVDDFLLSA